MFDSVNGSRVVQPQDGGNQLRCQVTANSGHDAFWMKAETEVRQWEFQRRTKSGILKKMPPSQKGWITTFRSIRGIWSFLHEQGFTSLRPRTLNQDPILLCFIRGGELQTITSINTKQFIKMQNTY